MIAILEYGMGNVFSVESALLRLGATPVITRDPAVLREAAALVIPGVGAFGQAMDNLRSAGLLDVLSEVALVDRKPVLGICLGMQLFADRSFEMGVHAGLGWIPGEVRRIDVDLPLPHVGWNTVQSGGAALFARPGDNADFYFDHTYELVCPAEHVTATVEYGKRIVAAVKRDNILGVQFHPEKSQTKGLKLLRAFLLSVEGGAC